MLVKRRPRGRHEARRISWPSHRGIFRRRRNAANEAFARKKVLRRVAKRGDVVVFRFPMDVSEFYVKRLIGLPGDVVRFERGMVSVNGLSYRSSGAL